MREAGAILPSREGNMAPFWQFETKWGHITLQGGQYGPIFPPGRVAWPHFEMGPCYPPLLLPWMNTEIRKLIRTRKRLHKEAKRLNNVETWSKFREARNTVTKHIRKAKLNYQNKLVEIINSSSTSPKTWFKVAKRLTQKQTTCTIPTLYDNNMEASTDISKAELLNSYFSRQSTLDDHDQQLPHNITSIESTLSHLTITPCDVKDAISLIDSSKASGPDFVSPKLLCEGSTELCTVLSHLFNSLLALSYFPQCLETSKCYTYI